MRFRAVLLAAALVLATSGAGRAELGVTVGAPAASAAAPAARPDGLRRVLTYNIRIGAGRQKWGASPHTLRQGATLDLAPIAAAIRSLAPDIVGLQEVLGPMQARDLADRLGMHHAYAAHALTGSGSWWGVALLSRRPIRRAGRHQISTGEGNNRANLAVEVDTEDGVETYVVIHKDKDIADGAPLRATLAGLDGWTPPLVLLGDLNIAPGDPRLDILSSRFADSAVLADTSNARFARKRGTWIGRTMTTYERRIDYVLIEPGAFAVVDAGLIPAAHWRASDHLGYYADLRRR